MSVWLGYLGSALTSVASIVTTITAAELEMVFFSVGICGKFHVVFLIPVGKRLVHHDLPCAGVHGEGLGEVKGGLMKVRGGGLR